MMNKTVFKKLRDFSLDFIIIIIPAAICIFLLPKALKLLLPFIIGSLIYFLAKPLNKLLKKKLPYSLSAFISLSLTASFFIFLVWSAFSTLLKELYGFAESLSAYYSSSQGTANFFGSISSIGRRFSVNLSSIPDISIFSDSLGTIFKDWISRSISELSQLLINIAKNIPSVIIIIFISFFTAFFMLKDSASLSESFRKILGERKYSVLIKFKSTLLSVLGKYLKAQLIIQLVIFVTLFAGFSFLRVDYVLLFALITAVVDAVPVLGTGTVLIPWSIFSFLSSDATLGWGLITLYGVCILTRQLLEPKIIGKKLGIHPLATIASIYIGLRVLGFFGIIIGPFIALFIKSLLSYDFTN